MRDSDFRFCSLLFSLSLLLLVAGCQKKNEPGSSTPFRIEAVESSLDSTIPVVEIASPVNDEIVSNDFSVYFASAGMKTADRSEHLHFMLDDGDIIEHFESNSPLNFTDIPDGQHMIRVFAVKEDHTSYKSENSTDMVIFYVNERKGKLLIEKNRPMLFLNIPSGNYEYVGDDSVLLDFWISNAKLGLYDYQVGYTLDGHEGTLSLWKTYVIKGLSEGKHKLILDLIDPNGKSVLGNFNHTVRTFNITK